MKFSAFINIATIMMLTACASHDTTVSLPDETFACRDGTHFIVRHNAGKDKINLSVMHMGSTATLTRTVANTDFIYVSPNGFYDKPTAFQRTSNLGILTFHNPHNQVMEMRCHRGIN